MQDLSSLSRLFKSENPKVQIIAMAIAALTFAPTVFRVMGDGTLNVWQRLEQLSYSAGQMVITVAALSLDPRSIEE